jgi:hypothetical protein
MTPAFIYTYDPWCSIFLCPLKVMLSTFHIWNSYQGLLAFKSASNSTFLLHFEGLFQLTFQIDKHNKYTIVKKRPCYERTFFDRGLFFRSLFANSFNTFKYLNSNVDGFLRLLSFIQWQSEFHANNVASLINMAAPLMECTKTNKLSVMWHLRSQDVRITGIFGG